MVWLSFAFGSGSWRLRHDRPVALRVLSLVSLFICLLGFSARADEIKNLPENKAPENKAPENKAPENKAPENKAPESKAPDGKVPEGTAPASKAAESKIPENTVPTVVDPAQAVLDRLRKMTVPLQQAWLRRLEARASRAARLTFDADEAKRQEAKVHAQLHQKVVTWQVLHTVIDEVDLREKGIVNRLVRQYGNLVFDTFHKQLDIYNQRRQAWSDVFIDWEHAGKPFGQQDRLIDWLDAAIRSAAPSAVGPIPEKPKFESEQPPAIVAPKEATETAKPQTASGGDEVLDKLEKAKQESEKLPASAAPKPPTETAKPQEPPKSQMPEKPKGEGEKPAAKAPSSQPAETAKPQTASGELPAKTKQESEKLPASAAPKPPTEPAKPQEPPKPETPEKPKLDSEKPPAKAAPKRSTETAKPQAASVVGKSPVPPAASVTRKPPAPQAPSTPRPSQDADKEMAKRSPRRAVEPPLALPEPAATLSAPSAAADFPARRHEVGRAGGDSEHTVEAWVGPPAMTARRAAEPPAIRGARVQLPPRQSAAIAVALPKVDEPVLLPVAASDLPSQDHVQSLSFRQAAVETRPAASEESPGKVEIESEELAARIRGCNLAFRALEVELEENSVWTAARLESLVDRLDILVLRRHDLELFRGVVPQQQRSSIEALVSAKSVVSPVAAHIVEARARASGAAFTGTEAERQRELGRLGELSRRLAALADK